MNVLVISDKIDYLISNQRKIEEALSRSNGNIYYFCSSVDMESDCNLPRDIEQKLARVRDYLEGYEERYDNFRNSVEQFYYKLCNKFNGVYSPCLNNFNLYDLSQSDVGVLLMEFVRIHDFIKYLVETKKITQIVILSNANAKIKCNMEAYDYLSYFPIDSMVGEVVSRELDIPFTKISVTDDSFKKLSLLISAGKNNLKDSIRSIYYFFSHMLALPLAGHSKNNPNLLVFGSLNHLLPVLKEIKNLNTLYYHPVPLIKISGILRQNKIKPIYKMGNTLFNKLKSARFNLKVRKIAEQNRATLKHKISDNLYGLLSFVFNEFCRHNVPLFLKRVGIYATIISKVTPMAILLDENVSSLRKPFEFAAKRKNIFTFVVNHGIPSKGDSTFMNKTISDSSYIFVGGQYLKDVLTNYYKAKPEKIIVTGTPRYDDLHKPGFSLCHSTDFNICLAPIFILKRSIICNSLDYMINFRDNLKVIIKKYKQKPFKLIVKFHPGDPREDFIRNMFSAEKVKAVYITDQIRSIDVLKKVDLVLTCWSQISLEAVLLNKPVIMMNNYTRFPSPYDFVENKIGVFAQSPKDLSGLLDNYFSNKGEVSFMNLQESRTNSFKYEDFQDGKASKRVADFLLKKIGANSQ